MPCMLKAGLRAATRWFKALDEFSRTGLKELATELTRPLPGNSNSAMATTTTGPTHRTHIQVTQAADSLKWWEDRRGFQPARKHLFQVCWLAQRLLWFSHPQASVLDYIRGPFPHTSSSEHLKASSQHGVPPVNVLLDILWRMRELYWMSIIHLLTNE